MKTNLMLLILFLLLQSFDSEAQQTIIFGLAKKTAVIKEVYFATVDPTSGNVSILSNPYITNHITVDGATLDNANNLYYYYSPGTINTNLNAVDIFSGNLSYSTPLNFPTGFYFDLIQFNCNDSSFYGLYRNSSLSELKLGRINVNTGVVTVLSANSIISYITDDYTYDKKNSTFFFSVSNTIKAVSLLTGNILNSTPIALPTGEYFENIDFNCNDSTLYGTYRNNSGLKFAKVNLTTGVVTVLSPSSFTLTFGQGGGHILDEDAGKYYFNTGTQIFTIDISNGNLINSATLSFSLAGTFNLYYIKKSLDCNCSNAVSVPEVNPVNQYNFHPNPMTTEFIINTNDNLPSEITLYDIASRKILQQKFTNSVSLNTEQLAKGIYIYELREKNGLCKKGKVVKN